MITEDYVSFETAKLLKEKGFDSECHSHYYPCHYPDGSIKYVKYNGAQRGTKRWYDVCSLKNLPKDHYLTPTLQMAMKWLRDTFHLEIYPFHDAIQENNDWWYRIERHSKGCSLTEHESDIIYKTYEEACEAAIKYCLENLI